MGYFSSLENSKKVTEEGFLVSCHYEKSLQSNLQFTLLVKRTSLLRSNHKEIPIQF